MSNKIAIVTDSTASLKDKLLKEYNIYTNYLTISFKQDSYKEFKDISTDKFLELCQSQDELPSTSQPAIGLTVELYEKLLADGYDEIIHITISGEVSGSFASATSAAEMVNAEKIHIFDSKTMVFAQGGLAIEASKLAKAGKTTAEIITELEKIRPEGALIAAIKNLENLRKGGRLSNASAVIGGLLQIKPVVHLATSGKIEALGKVRTFKKTIGFLADQARAANLDESKYEFCILNTQNSEDAAMLKKQIREIYPTIPINEDTELSLVIASHTGTGAIAVGWYKRVE